MVAFLGALPAFIAALPELLKLAVGVMSLAQRVLAWAEKVQLRKWMEEVEGAIDQDAMAKTPAEKMAAAKRLSGVIRSLG